MRRRTLLVCGLALFAVLSASFASAQGPAQAELVYLPGLSAAGSALVAVSGGMSLRPLSRANLETYQPERYVLVLDVSGSMNMNLAGQGKTPDTGETIQCVAAGPDAPLNFNCGLASYAWEPASERRIYQAKQAAEEFIGGLNLPGNSGYDSALPPDQVTIIWFNQGAPSAWRFPASWDGAADAAALRDAVRQAGSVGGDPYKTDGGTNGAAALHRARQALDEAPGGVTFGGKSYSYRNEVVLLTDGVQNFFLDTQQPDLNGGRSEHHTYEPGNRCRELGPRVGEDAGCQTTEEGGTYNGKDRPITQTLRQAQTVKAQAALTVIAFSVFDYLGLPEVASPERFFDVSPAAPSDTSLGDVFARVTERERGPGGCAALDGGWVAAIAEPPAELPGGLLGEVALTSAEGQFRAPARRDPASGELSFQLDGVPPGEYFLNAYLWHQGADGKLRLYDRLVDGDGAASQLQVVSVPAGGQSVSLPRLRLVTGSDVCGA